MVSLMAPEVEAVDRAQVEKDYLAKIDHALATTFLQQPIFAHFKIAHLGAMRVIELEASPRRSDRTRAHIARDRHDGISIQLALAGSSIGEAAGKRVLSSPGTITVLDFAQPFYMTDQERRTVVNVSIPRAVLGSRVADVRSLHGEVIGKSAAGLLAANLCALPLQLESMSKKAVSVVSDYIIDLLLLALEHDSGTVLAREGSRHAILRERAMKIIDGRIGSIDLTPDRLTAQLNVSRSDLYAAFSEFGGVAKFIWSRRLKMARAALVDSKDSRRIGEIAFAFGFSNEAHFARAFRRAFGETASAVRKSQLPT